jgi:hypothetical protein
MHYVHFRISVWLMLLCSFGVAVALLPVGAQTPSQEEMSQVVPKVDERIELTSIVARLAGYGEYTNNQFKQYADDVDRYFAAFQHHPVVEFAKQVRDKDGIGFDAMPSLAVHLNPPPLLTPRVEFSASAPDSRWGKADAEKFATLLQQFYRNADCARFFRDHAAMYRLAEQRFQAPLNAVKFGWYRSFYGERPAGTFNLIIGLLNGGGNYGPRVIHPDGSEDLYAIMGTWRTDKQGMPIYGDEDFPTIIHEYNHSFVNKLIYKNAPLFEKSGAAILSHTADQMRQQGYSGWQTLVLESLVRACVVQYLKRNPTGKMTAQIQLAEEESRSFLWTGLLTGLLDDYERNRKRYPTLESFIPRVAELFTTIPGRLPELQKCLALQQPQIAGVAPFPNEASNVDPNIREIRIRFDRSMMPGAGYYTINARNPFVHPPTLMRDGKTLVGQIKIERNHEYGVGLPSYAFRSKQGFRPAKDFILRFTTQGYMPPPPDPHFGYKLEKGQVTFLFVKPDYLDAEIKNVAVAGEFNNWNPKADGYELHKTGENVYELTIPGGKLGKPGEKRQFQFVVNGDTWIQPARQALNVNKEAGLNSNLIIELDPVAFD